MSIKILPTTASGLSHADYTVLIGGALDPHQERARKVSNTISGIPVATLWAKTKVGATQDITATVSASAYEKLKTIAYHATVFEWLVISRGARFVCSIDLLNAEKTTLFGDTDYYNLQLTFLVIEEL